LFLHFFVYQGITNYVSFKTLDKILVYCSLCAHYKNNWQFAVFDYLYYRISLMKRKIEGGNKMKKYTDNKSLSAPGKNSANSNLSNSDPGNHSAIKPTTKSAIKPVIKSRRQEGNFHVYFRGNSKHTIFYNDDDFIIFLKKCDFFAKKYDTTIFAFAVMNNHVHIHLYTKDLTTFMRAMLGGFARTYNKRKGLSDKIFKTPFGSSHTYSKALTIENLLYIFSNPINAGICSNPWEYKWSSYHFHNEGKKNPLRAFIDIDTSLVNSAFPNKNSLDKAIFDFIADILERRMSDRKSNGKNDDKNDDKNGRLNSKQNSKSYWPMTPDYEVINHMNTILAGRHLFSLSAEELKTLMIRLRLEKYATFRQIATLTHESYVEVRRFFNCQLF